MARWLFSLAIAAVLGIPQLASANGLHWLIGGTRTSQYAPPVVYYVSPPATLADPCVRPGPAVFPNQTAPPPILGDYAVPKAAPPSATPAPSPARPAPAVNESRSFYDSYSLAPNPREFRESADASVGFWNLSEQDVTLEVAGQTHLLPRGKSLQLRLPRRFVWAVKSRESVTERLPEAAPGVEIVIRK